MIIRIVLSILLLVLIYFRPLHIISFIFLSEYLYIMIYLLNIRKNFNDYHCLDVIEIHTCNLSIPEIWIEYSKLMAFKRIYSVLSKKKINLYVIIMSFCFFIFDIPKRFLDLAFYFIFKNKKSFREGLEILYYHSYYQLRYSKIEVLNREFTLNCFTFNKLIVKIKHKNIGKQEMFNLFWDLKEASKDFDRYELNNQQYVKMISGGIITEENVRIKVPHFIYEENNSTIHSTSNIDIRLENSQSKCIPMPSFIKPGAKNPGTIISVKSKIYSVTGAYKIIPMYELNLIKFYNIEIFDLSCEYEKYIKEKQGIYIDILRSHLNNFDDVLVRELTGNLYTNAFSNLSNKDIIDELDRIRNDDII